MDAAIAVLARAMLGGASLVSDVKTNTLFTGDNLPIMHGMNSEIADLIYLDPPFNSKRLYRAPMGSKAAGTAFKDMWSWKDIDEAYLEQIIDNYPFMVQLIQSVSAIHGKPMAAYLTYMAQRIIEMHRILKMTGSLYLHCDPTASHYLKLILDRIFREEKGGGFQNELIWHFGLGGSSPKRYSKKHHVIFFYTKSNVYHFDKPQIPATSNKMKGQMKGITDVWNIPNINNNDTKERTGYPTQKPLALLRRIIQASSREGDVVFDPFCGCATTMVAAQQLNRKWIGIDIAPKSAELVVERLSDDAGLFSDFVHIKESPVRTDITQEKPTQNVKARLYENQEGQCNACGVEMDIFNLEIDHIIPRSKGGGDYYDNYQLLCSNCNRTKGNRPMEYLLAKIRKRNKALRFQLSFGEK